MRFKLTEDLEQDLIKQAERIDNITNKLNDLFNNAGFDQSIDVNGISYTFKNDVVNSMFYIDDELNHNGYTESDRASFNVEGPIGTVEADAQLIIDNTKKLSETIE